VKGGIPFDGVTLTVSSFGAATVTSTALCIFASSGTEPRAHIPIWDEIRSKRSGLCVEVTEQRPREFVARIGSTERTLVLTDVAALHGLFSSRVAYIDISGLAHHVWAPLIRAGLKSVDILYAVYAEPDSYKAHPSPASTTLYDLSEGFRGLEPLPGFANLAGPARDAASIFVPFLGFEGPRARYLAMSLDPLPKVIPVVGVPGFRLEYPQVAVVSNQEFLSENNAYSEIRFARASCPFEAYSVLDEIRRDNPGSFLYLAPVGTKPHALGVVWYAIEHSSDTEIMYDHPRRKPNRTEGVGLVHVYKLKPRDADL